MKDSIGSSLIGFESIGENTDNAAILASFVAEGHLTIVMDIKRLELSI